MGILENHPIITMVGIKDPKNHQEDKLDQYYRQLGLQRYVVQPETALSNFRVFHDQDISNIDSMIFDAAMAAGQAMQEIARPHIYRRDGDPETQHLPRLDWNHLRTERAPIQMARAQQWVEDHQHEIADIVEYCRNQNSAEIFAL